MLGKDEENRNLIVSVNSEKGTSTHDEIVGNEAVVKDEADLELLECQREQFLSFYADFDNNLRNNYRERSKCVYKMKWCIGFMRDDIPAQKKEILAAKDMKTLTGMHEKFQWTTSTCHSFYDEVHES